MSWIDTVPYEASEGKLRVIYDGVRGPNGELDNVLSVHSLRPHTLQGHLALYKSVLHHTGNQVPVWLLETIGVYVSRLNRCGYCVDHHLAGLARLVGQQRAHAIVDAMDSLGHPFDDGQRAMLRYVEKLTRDPASMTHADIEALRDTGISDGEILEVNQVASYFAYVNRTVLGLGVNTAGDLLGLSPANSDAVDDWQHG